MGREKGLFLPCWWIEVANGESDRCFWECAVENEEGVWDLPVCQQWARVESCPEWIGYVSSKDLGFAGFITLPPAGNRTLLRTHFETLKCKLPNRDGIYEYFANIVISWMTEILMQDIQVRLWLLSTGISFSYNCLKSSIPGEDDPISSIRILS